MPRPHADPLFDRRLCRQDRSSQRLCCGIPDRIGRVRKSESFPRVQILYLRRGINNIMHSYF